jgi:LmbE family N-acetylglucosaminyl deacetylase
VNAMRNASLRALVVVAALSSLLVAQSPEPEAGLVALHQARLDAITSGVVLNVAAHPDDESSRTNTILRRKHGLRVVTAYSTYGDGGQNAIGKEIGPELARLRVRETLAAAGMMDFEVRWLGMPDFGYSKSLDETLAIWGKDALLDAMRKVVDEVDPDFVVTNHDLVHGHGHHRASFWAITQVVEERSKAGKHAPAVYSRCSLEDAQWTVDPSELDAVRGETYARLAHRAWTQHVTQGPWSAHEPLQVGKDYWKLVSPEGASRAAAADPLSWIRGRFGKANRELAVEIGGVMWDVPTRPAVSCAASSLAKLREWAKELPFYTGIHPQLEVAAESKRRISALQRILLADAGVRVECWLDSDEVPRGGEGKVYVVVHGMARVKNLVVRCGDRNAEPVAPRVRSTMFDAMPAVPAGATPADLGMQNGANGAAPQPVATPQPQPPVPGRLAVAFANAAPRAVPPEVEFVTLDVSFDLVDVPAPLSMDVHYIQPPTQTVRIELQQRLAFSTVEPVEVAWDRAFVMVPKDRAVERIFSRSGWLRARASAPRRSPVALRCRRTTAKRACSCARRSTDPRSTRSRRSGSRSVARSRRCRSCRSRRSCLLACASVSCVARTTRSSGRSRTSASPTSNSIATRSRHRASRTSRRCCSTCAATTTCPSSPSIATASCSTAAPAAASSRCTTSQASGTSAPGIPCSRRSR